MGQEYSFTENIHNVAMGYLTSIAQSCLILVSCLGLLGIILQIFSFLIKRHIKPDNLAINMENFSEKEDEESPKDFERELFLGRKNLLQMKRKMKICSLAGASLLCMTYYLLAFLAMFFPAAFLLTELLVDHVGVKFVIFSVTTLWFFTWRVFFHFPLVSNRWVNPQKKGSFDVLYFAHKEWKPLCVCGSFLLAFIMTSSILAFSLEGMCICSQPVEISTRMTRRFSAPICRSGVPCATYLTLAEDPSTSMIVNFYSPDFHSDASVLYSVGSNYTTGQDFEFSMLANYVKLETKDVTYYVYSAYLSHLPPSTVIHFRTGFPSQNYFSDTKTFMTLTEDPNSNITFINGGDVGITPLSHQISRIAASTSPSFALIGGDLAYANNMGTCYRRWDSWLKNWEQEMVTPSGHSIPLLTAIGNHEAGKFNSSRDQVVFYLHFFPHNKNQVFDIGPQYAHERASYHFHDISERMRLIILDSAVSVSVQSQNEWILKTMQETKLPIVPAYHSPIYPATYDNDDLSRMQSMRENWVPLFDMFNVSVAFENHAHMFKYTKKMTGGEENEDGTLYIGDGCWGTKPEFAWANEYYVLSKSADIYKRNHFMHLTLTPQINSSSQMTIKVIDNNNNNFFSTSVHLRRLK